MPRRRVDDRACVNWLFKVRGDGVGSRRDAASTIVNLPDYRVIDAVELPGEQRQVVVESCACREFSESTVHVPARVRSMARLCEALVAAADGERRHPRAE